MRWLKDNLILVAMAAAAVLLAAPVMRAQSDGIVDVSGAADPQAQPAGRALPALPFWSQTAGQADVAFQGYYLNGSGQPLISTTGAAINLKEFLPGLGLLHAAVEGYGGNGFHTGTTFVGLEQMPFAGWHWDFIGGDSQLSSSMLANHFTNIYTPDLSERGIHVAVKRKNRTYQIFAGEDSLLGGPRIPYRLTLPQMMLGGSMQQQIGARWQIGVRFLHLSTNPSALANYANFSLPGHSFEKSDSITLQSSYDFTKHLRMLGEFSYGKVTPFTLLPETGTQEPLSFFVGPAWETDRFTLRANYVSQSVSYLPVLGYFSGDRRGPFAEGHYRVNRRIDLYGSASAYSNNLEKNPTLPTFHSSGVTGGASFVLPWAFSASASISTLHLTSLAPDQPESISDNRQLNFSVSRSIRRHSLRFSYIDMKLNSNLLPQAQRFTEVDDTFVWKRLVLGGGIRLQGTQSTENRNTLFFRGSIQANIRRLSVYANFEKGSDLVNSSVFSTNAYTSTVAGLSAPVTHGWSVAFEAFRNNLNTTLNPQNVFLFPGQNLGVTQLPGFNQWSAYFRISKTFRWGNDLAARGVGGLDQYVAQRVPLVGSVQGVVLEQSLEGQGPAGNVVVSLDHYRTATTDATGRYVFLEVPEGSHEVGVDMDQLATDYEPGPNPSTHVIVEPQAIVRSDFSVVRLSYVTGKIAAPASLSTTDIVIRLAGTNRYTTPDEDGNFSFYNLREGEYNLAVDTQTLPEEVLLASAPSVDVMVSDASTPAAPVEFKLELKPQAEKPVRQILRQQIHVAAGSPKPAARPIPAGGSNRPATGDDLPQGGSSSGATGGGGGGGGGGQ